MRINPNAAAAAMEKLGSQSQTEGTTKPSRLGADNLALSASEAVDQAWQNVPEVRPEKVAQAKALLSQDSYPSESQIEDVAGLLAKYLSK